jgi:hypothetical protein
MEKPSTYRIHVNSFLHLDWFAPDVKEDIFIELPDCFGLDEKVCYINKLCSEVKQKQQNYCLENFLMEKYLEIKKAETEGNKGKIPELLKQINSYNSSTGKC